VLVLVERTDKHTSSASAVIMFGACATTSSSEYFPASFDSLIMRLEIPSWHSPSMNCFLQYPRSLPCLFGYEGACLRYAVSQCFSSVAGSKVHKMELKLDFLFASFETEKHPTDLRLIC
jgi:hypothetical protein